MKTPRANGDKSRTEPRGPAVWENWTASLRPKPSKSADVPVVEVPLFTDAPVYGEPTDGYGPYLLLNAERDMSLWRYAVPRPAIVLRAEGYLAPQYEFEEIAQEIAALLSLSLGLRLKPGGVSRHFWPGDPDPKGTPTARPVPQPVLLTSYRGAVLPRVRDRKQLDHDNLVSRLWLVQPEDAAALVRAARLYQDAVWIAESQPELSWLMLVSAVETAAGDWCRAKQSPRDAVLEYMPELEKSLAPCGDDVVQEACKLLAPLIGSKKKFLVFMDVDKFCPPEPAQRPKKLIWQHSWARADMEVSMKTIYNYRSKALHAGTPFPSRMCEPPTKPDGTEFVEVPPFDLNGNESIEETPMLLHTFEYIVQGALCKWWESMIPKEQAAEALRPCSG